MRTLTQSTAPMLRSLNYANKTIHTVSYYMKLINLFLLLLTLSACTTFNSKTSWPDDVPDKNIFVQAFEQQHAANTTSTLPEKKLQQQLFWVMRFYRGNAFYPVGWNSMTKMVLDSIDDTSQVATTTIRIAELGKRICIEWAQDNRIAKISTANIIVWSNALRKAVQNNQQLWFLSQAEQDVEDLIAGRLHKHDIKLSRYYGEEDFDDF